MVTPKLTQRADAVDEKLEEVESRLVAIEGRLADQQTSLSLFVAEAVGRAMADTQKAITDHFSVLFEAERKRQEEGRLRLEGRIDRLRTDHEVQAEAIARGQDKFQEDIRATVATNPQPRPPPPPPITLVVDGDNSPNRGENEIRHSVRRGGREERNGEEEPYEHRSWHGGGGGGGAGNGGGQWRHRKLEMPLFAGTDPDNWILRAEMFFEFYQLTEREKLEASVVAMDGAALKWYQWGKKRRPIAGWMDLKQRVLYEFRPSHAGSLYEQWLAVEQVGSVEEYRRKYIEIAAPLEGIPESIMLAQFINGLKGEIKTELRMLNPFHLEGAMELAGRIEEKNRVGQSKKWSAGGYKHGPAQTFPYGTSITKASGSGLIQTYGVPSHTGPSKSWATSTQQESQASVNKGNVTGNSQARSTTHTRRLTEAELQERRAKNLCFRCDEKWAVGHRCKRKEMSVLIVSEEDVDSDKGNEVAEEAEVEVSLCSVVGISNPKTMKLRGEVGGKPAVVMIDPGATHNFISLKLVTKATIPVEKRGEFCVSLGNGETVNGMGCADR